ncbi:hypothetical protein OOZ15_13975 [Galbibacter sp. EGI 63066]|uniref:hypothetical protein n=1 Tax=Galbibacter sp. EGI 63066 TaxID=2993559 RepID=UPI002249415E|nr:hypothetical protein [Galbibacter sp. EGI 63066]MCX2681056.1 hypothetical protein [Galbibacter sp. EGI 63066]
MKKIIPLFILLILFNCKSKNEFEGQFLSAIEVTALNVNENPVDFNIGYTVEFEQVENQDCLVESKEELNSMIIEPTVRSVVRGFIGQLDNNGIKLIDKEDIKGKINKVLSEGDISLNTEKFMDCPLKISMFAITRRK